MSPFIRWAFWAVAIYAAIAGQALLSFVLFVMGIFPWLTILVIVVLCFSGCTTYNIYDSYNNTDVHINDVKFQRSPINPNNPYKREIK